MATRHLCTRLLAGALVAASTASIPATAQAARAIRLDATTVQRNLLDLGEPGFTLGDQIAFSDDLRDGAGDAAGIDGGNCTLVRITDAATQSGTAHCRVTYALKRGQITTQGLGELTGGGFEGTQTVAITGGTGRYRKARGEAVLRSGRDRGHAEAAMTPRRRAAPARPAAQPLDPCLHSAQHRPAIHIAVRTPRAAQRHYGSLA